MLYKQTRLVESRPFVVAERLFLRSDVGFFYDIASHSTKRNL